MEVKDTRVLPLTGGGIETPHDLAYRARIWLDRSRGEMSSSLNLAESTISRYESGNLKMPAGYLAYLIGMVADVVAQDQEQGNLWERNAGTWHDVEEYRRHLLRLTNSVFTNNPSAGIRTPFQTWEDLRKSSAAYLAKRQMGATADQSQADSFRTSAERTSVPKRAAPQTREIQEQQSHAAQSEHYAPAGRLEQPESGPPATTQEQPLTAFAATSKSAGNPAHRFLSTKITAAGLSLVALVAILLVASFVSSKNQEGAKDGSAKTTGIADPTSETVHADATNVRSAALATNTPYSRSAAPVENSLLSDGSAFKGSMSAPPGPLSTQSQSPTPAAVVHPYTSTPFYAPTMTPSSTPTKVQVPTQTPTVPVTLRTGAVCYDGEVSCSTGSGTCSGHKGVSRWIYYPEYPPSCP